VARADHVYDPWFVAIGQRSRVQRGAPGLQFGSQRNTKVGMENRVVTILGCTASGKGSLARALASEIGGEIVSVDSMKVYRGMDIGTAKPTREQRAAIPHHLIDVADPWESFSTARFVELADRAVAEIHGRDRLVIAVGGTVLYFKCFYEGMFSGPAADPGIRAEIRARAEREGLDALHAELAGIDPKAPEIREVWKRIKAIGVRILDALVRQIADDYQTRDLDYWDSRGALLPWSVALGGQAFYDELLAGAEIRPEPPGEGTGE